MKKSFFLMGLLGVTLGGSSEAQASSCGEDYELVPSNVEVTTSPQRDCVVVDVKGSSRPGCDQLVITITNQCEDVIQVPEPTRQFGCAENYSSTELIEGSCPILYVGYTIVVDEPTHSEGHHKVDIRLLEQAGPIDVHIEFDAVDQAEDSCAIAPGVKGVGVSGIGATIALLGLALRRRRRKRARRSL
ncbi:MAG: hypothetical protein HOV80_08180 [Polyangiaceae bacterium]|nr:hypothetical protein [Polyangiaceae bacterium]